MKVLFVVCSFFLCLSATANMQEQEQEQEHIHKLAIAAPEIRPFIFKNEAGVNSGLLIDTIQRLNNSGKFNITVQIMPWARALKEVKNGRFDALMPAVYTSERTKYLSFPQFPLINFYGSEIFKRSNDDFVFQKVSLIDKSKVIVKVRSTMLETKVEQEFTDALIKFVEVTSLEDAINMLIKKHADLLVADSIIANSTIKKMSLSQQLEGFSLINGSDPSFLAFSKEYAKTHNVNALMQSINTINDPDSYHQLNE